MLSSSLPSASSSSSSFSAEELRSSSTSETEEIIYYCPFHKNKKLTIPCSTCGWKFPVGELEQITYSPTLISQGERIWKTTCEAVIFRTFTFGHTKCKLSGGWLVSDVRSWFQKRKIIYKKRNRSRGDWIIKKK